MRSQYSVAVQKLFGHSQQTYDFTPSWRSKWTFKSALQLNFFWHVTRQPSTFIVWLQQMCLELVMPRSEQCLHEYGFAPVWIRTWSFRLSIILNCFPRWTDSQSHDLLLLWTCCLCVCKWPDCVKRLLHTEHLYGLSPVWTLMWVNRLLDWLNALSHKWHLYGLSPMWTLVCMFRLPNSPNALSQMWHLYGFSPLWILPCLTRSCEVAYRLPQMVHSNGFSPEWIRRLCTVNDLLPLKHFPHSVHLCLLLWIFIWLLKWCSFTKSLPHWVQQHNCISSWTFEFVFTVNRSSHTVLKSSLGLSSCGCSVISLLSASTFTSREWSPSNTFINISLPCADTQLLTNFLSAVSVSTLSLYNRLIESSLWSFRSSQWWPMDVLSSSAVTGTAVFCRWSTARGSSLVL